MTAGTGADQYCLAHPRMYTITLLPRAAFPRDIEILITPSLSEFSELEDMGPLSAIDDYMVGVQPA